MKIGVPKEILDQEYRVALNPSGVYTLVQNGHEVYIEKGAGEGSYISDENFISSGAKILSSASEIFDLSDLIIKVKQPLENECKMLKKDQLLFTFLHLAADKKLAELLCGSKSTCIAYETIEDKNGRLPLLVPMSEVAGRMAVQIGARQLEKYYGGRGVLLGAVPGVDPGKVLIIGAGTVGFNAAKIAIGMGANTFLLDKSLDRLREVDNLLFGRVHPLFSTEQKLNELLLEADLVITATLVPGDKAPKLITKDTLLKMKDGSVIVDVSIDQGGCVEGVSSTSHSKPIVNINGINIYAVPNIPGAVPSTSTNALVNSTLPYILRLANDGLSSVIQDPLFVKGINIHNGSVAYEVVANALGMECVKPSV